jgi:hypothetical protein
MDIAIKVLAPFFGPPQAIVIARSERSDALNAAFLNAASANVLEYDDTHLGTVMHPAAPVASGLFALRRRHRGNPGRDRRRVPDRVCARIAPQTRDFLLNQRPEFAVSNRRWHIRALLHWPGAAPLRDITFSRLYAAVDDHFEEHRLARR